MLEITIGRKKFAELKDQVTIPMSLYDKCRFQQTELLNSKLKSTGFSKTIILSSGYNKSEPYVVANVKMDSEDGNNCIITINTIVEYHLGNQGGTTCQN